MAFPEYVPTRVVTVGGAMSVENADSLLRVSVEIRSSHSLIWDATGYRFEKTGKAAVGELGTEVSVILPRTDVAGWKDAATGSVIDVSVPDSYSHRYTAVIRFIDQNGRTIGTTYTVGPFVLPAGTGAVDLDKMVPASSIPGGQVSIPDVWSQMVAAAEAAATAAEAALIDSAQFVADEIGTPGTPANVTLSNTIEAAVFDKASVIQVSPGVNLYNPSGLRRWWAGLSEADYRACTAVAIGDSTVQGVGAEHDGVTQGAQNDTNYRAGAWPTQLQRRFAAEYGDTGASWVTIWSSDDRVTLDVAGAFSATGMHGTGMVSNANPNPSDDITVEIEDCTTIDLWTWDGGQGTFNYSIDGGAAVTGTVAGTGNGGASQDITSWTKHTITGLTEGPHTLKVWAPGTTDTNKVYVTAVLGRKADTGVFIHRLGIGGTTTMNLLGKDSANTSNSANTIPKQNRIKKALGVVPGPVDLFIFSFLANDYARQNTTFTSHSQPGATPVMFEANLREAIAEATRDAISGDGHRGASVLLLGQQRGYPGNAPSPLNYTESEYIDAMKAIAADTEHVSFLDIADVFGPTWDDGQELNLYINNSVHLKRKGYGSVANLLYRVLSRPYGFEV